MERPARTFFIFWSNGQGREIGDFGAMVIAKKEFNEFIAEFRKVREFRVVPEDMDFLQQEGCQKSFFILLYQIFITPSYFIVVALCKN